MKKIIIFCSLVVLCGMFVGCATPSANVANVKSGIEPKQTEIKPETVMLYSYPKNGIYYYYVSDFNIDTFKKPEEVKPAENTVYHIFIYDKKLSAQQLNHRDRYDIMDDFGYLFDMISVGVENEPIAYVHRSLEDDEVKVYACRFEQDNEQIRYVMNPETGKFVNQMRFYNGELGISNICNPNFVPGQDI